MKPDIIVSPVLAINTPFIEYNDGTRLQMAHQQSKQSVPLLQNEVPLVQTTLETQTIDQNLFEPELIIAKRSGQVVYSGNQLVVVQYDNKEYGYWFVEPVHESLQIGDEFEQGDVIAQIPNYFIDTTVAQGKNLVVSVMNHPYSYEDALVLSEKAKDKLNAWQYETLELIIPENIILLSIDDKDYRILPRVHETFKKNTPILITKEITTNKIFEKPKIYKYNKDIEIVSVEVYPQTWNTKVREYSTVMRAIRYQLQDREEWLNQQTIPERFKNMIKLNEHLVFDKKVYYRKEKFKGVYIKIIYKYVEPVDFGDKFSNRYANKATVSYFAPEGALPSMDGLEADIVVSPMSIISRMNVGQLYESFASGCIHYLKKKLRDLNFTEGAELVYKFYKTIDNTHDKRISNQVKHWLKKVSNWDYLINYDYVFPAPPFEASTKKQLTEVAKLVGYPVFFGKDNIHMGYMYFYRLVHIARHKVAARSIGDLSRKTLQPIDGTGAQRLGEMEVWTLLAYDAEYNLKEMLTTKSDDIQRKIDYVLKTLYDLPPAYRNSKPESVRLLDAYFKILDAEIKHN